MNDPSLLSFSEQVWLGLVVIQILGLFVWCWSQPQRHLAWFQPPVMLSVVFLYYTVAGPLHALQEGKWIDRGVNLRYGMEIAWQGAAVAFAAFLVGYGLIRQQLPPPRRSTSFDSSQAWRLGQTLNVLGITLFGLLTGPRLLVLLNPLTARQAEAVGRGLDFGPFANYAGLAVNFLIPGILLLTAVWASQRRGGLQLVLWLIAAQRHLHHTRLPLPPGPVVLRGLVGVLPRSGAPAPCCCGDPYGDWFVGDCRIDRFDPGATARVWISRVPRVWGSGILCSLVLENRAFF